MKARPCGARRSDVVKDIKGQEREDSGLRATPCSGSTKP